MGRPRKNPIDPIERFPLKPRADGRFQKRIRNRLYYFGFDGNRTEALREYDRAKHDLYAGRAPHVPADDDVTTLKDLGRMFLDDRWAEVRAGRLDKDWYAQHERALERFAAFVGPGRSVGDLRPEDFSGYGRHLSGKLKMSGNTFNRERSSVVALFNWAKENGKIERPIVMGRGFRRIPKGTIRAKKRFRLIEPKKLTALLAAAGPQMRAMILLGINGGFGAEECGKLKWSTLSRVKLEAGPVRLIFDHRAKTNIVRECPLWSQTVAALARLRRSRSDDPFVFRTKYGNPWTTESVAHAFAKLKSGHTFYDLRRTFLTYANETGDTDATKRIAGRKLPDMQDTYVQMLVLARMVKVVEHVRLRML